MSKLVVAAKKLLHKSVTDAARSAQEVEDEANGPSTSAAAKQKKTVYDNHIQSENVFGHIKETRRAEQDECYTAYKSGEALNQLIARDEWKNEEKLEKVLLEKVWRVIIKC